MTPTKRIQMIQRLRNSASLLRGYAYTWPITPDERRDVYDAAQNMEEAAHRVALDDMSDYTRELMIFAYVIVGVAGIGLGVIVTLLFT